MISGSNALVAVNRRNGSGRPVSVVQERQMPASTPVLQMLLAEVTLFRREVNDIGVSQPHYPAPTRVPDQQQIVRTAGNVEHDRKLKIFD